MRKKRRSNFSPRIINRLVDYRIYTLLTNTNNEMTYHGSECGTRIFYFDRRVVGSEALHLDSACDVFGGR